MGPNGEDSSSGSSDNAQNQDLSSSRVKLIERVRWLINLRWLAFAGVTSTVLIARQIFASPLPWNRLLATALTIPVYNLVLYLVWRLENRSGQRSNLAGASAILANVQICCDLLALGALIHFSGGVENPFGFYFVFHMVIASNLLSPRATYAQATFAVVIFLSVAMGEYFGVIGHYCSPIGVCISGLHKNPVVVLGYCWVMTTCLYVTVYLATSISSRLRWREGQVVSLSRELTRHTNELQQAYDRLADLDKAKSAYTRKVAHELRSPLAAADGLLRTVAEGLRGEVSKDASETIARTRIRIHELLQVVRDLLTLASAMEIKKPSRLAHVDLRTELDGVVGLLSENARDRKITVNARVDDTLPRIPADREGIAEVLTNLLSNAIKYSFEGGTVDVRIFHELGKVLIEVADSGIGIEAAELEKIFDEFHRTDNARKFTPDGTGLGLSIVKQIVKAHGGTIDVTSSAGAGTVFKVCLHVT